MFEAPKHKNSSGNMNQVREMCAQALGLSRLKTGDFTGALEMLAKLSAAQMADFRSQYGLGVAHFNLNQLQEAAACFDEAAKLRPNDRKAPVYAAAAQILVHQVNEAEMILLRALDVHGYSESICGLLGMVQQAQGKDEAMLDLFSRFFEMGGESFALHAASAVVHEKMGEHELALLHWQASSVTGRFLYLSLSRMAWCHYAMKKFSSAAALFERCLKMNPADTLAQRGFGLSQFEMGKFEAAAEYLGRLNFAAEDAGQPVQGLPGQWEFIFYSELSRSLRSSGFVDEGRPFAKLACEQAPNMAEGWFEWAHVLKEYRKDSEALEVFLKAAQLPGASPEIMGTAVEFAERIGRRDSALKIARLALKTLPESPVFQGHVDRLSRRRKKATAEKKTDTVPQESPVKTGETWEKGLEAETLQKYDLALKLYEQAAKEGMRTAELFKRIGQIYLQKKEYASARDAFQSSLEQEPSSKEVWKALANAQLDLQDAAAALVSLENCIRLSDDPAPFSSEIVRTLRELKDIPALVHFCEKLDLSKIHDPSAVEEISGLYIRAGRQDILWKLIPFWRTVCDAECMNRILVSAEAAVDMTDEYRKMRAEAAAQLGQWAETVRWMARMNNLDANSRAFAIQAAESLLKQKNFSDYAIISELSEKVPDEPSLLSLLGQSYEASGDVNAAEKSYSRLLEMHPGDANTALKLASVLKTKGDFKGVLNLAEQIEKEEPLSPEFMIMAAEAYLGLNDDTYAMEWTAKTLQNAAPQAVASRAWQIRVEILKRKKDWSEVVFAYETLKKLNPENKEWDAALAESKKMAADLNPSEAQVENMPVSPLPAAPLKSYAEARKDADAAGSAELWDAAGRAAFAEKMSDEAVECFSKAMELKNDWLDLYFRLGQAYEAADSRRKALDVYILAIGVSPESAEAHYHAGRIYAEMAKKDEAYNEIREALRLDANHQPALLLFAAVCQERGQTDLALSALRRIYESDPKAEAAKKFADLLCMDRHYEEALAVYQKLLADEPGSRDLLLSLGKCYLGLHRGEEALAQFRAVLDMSADDSSAIAGIGKAEMLLSHYENAAEHFEKLMGGNESQPDFLKDLAQAYYQLKQTSKAISVLEKELKENGDQPDVHKLMGDIYFSDSKFAEAEMQYRRAVGLSPQSAAAVCAHGFACARLGQTDEAVRSFEKAIELQPENIEAKFNLGVLYLKSRKMNEAEGMFKKTIEQNPQFGEGFLGLGTLNRELGRSEEALQAYSKAAQLSPRNPEAHYLLGVQYVQAGKRSEALSQYRILMGLDEDYAESLFKKIYNRAA